MENRMSYGFLDIAVTPSVQAAQRAMGSEEAWSDFRGHRKFDRFGPNEAAFIAARDTFYIASVSETGWPYVQHRGGPQGFLRQLDDRTLGFADFSGNRQYLSLGNIGADNRVSLILMDYPGRARLKIFAHAEVASAADPALAERIATPGYRGHVERFILLHLDAFDWNCAQHIVQRFSGAEIVEAVAPLRERLIALEAENAVLRREAGRQTDQSPEE
jgi:uncharacterized protein